MGRKHKLLKNIGERVFKNFSFLKKLAKTRSNKKRDKLLAGADLEELLAITEISSNILAGQFPITQKQRQRLLPYADFVRKIAKLRSEKGSRKFYKNQKGGQAFFGALLAPILVEAARHLISKITKNGE